MTGAHPPRTPQANAAHLSAPGGGAFIVPTRDPRTENDHGGRFPGGRRQTPPPKCGCRPWSPAVHTLSRSAEARTGQQDTRKTTACRDQPTTCKDELSSPGTRPPHPAPTFPSASFTVPAASARHALGPQIRYKPSISSRSGWRRLEPSHPLGHLRTFLLLSRLGLARSSLLGKPITREGQRQTRSDPQQDPHKPCGQRGRPGPGPPAPCSCRQFGTTPKKPKMRPQTYPPPS